MTQMTQVRQGAQKPSGTKALLYAVLSLAVSPVLWVATFLLYRVITGDLSVFGFALAVVSIPVALVVALIQRLSSTRQETVRLSRVALFAVGIPTAVLIAGAIAGAIL